MENRQLFVNDYRVDFSSKDEPIPLILQVNDLGDLQSLQGNGSKTFKLPLTQRNRTIFGYPDQVQLTDNSPYQQLPAKFVVDGIEIVSNGLISIMNVQNNEIDVMLTFGNLDFLDKLGGQIYDMGDSTTPWSGYGTNKVWDAYSDCIWDVSPAANSQKKTDGWIWPIINYGDISTLPPFTGHINVRNIRPAFFLHTAIELLVKSTGYDIDYENSCLYNDPTYANLYQKLLIAFSNSSFEHGTDWQNTPDNLGATYVLGTNQTIFSINRDPGTPEGVINFGPISRYTATRNVDFTATVQFDSYLKGRFNSSGSGQYASRLIVKFVIINLDGSTTDGAIFTVEFDANYTRLQPDKYYGGDILGEEYFYNQKLSSDFSLVAGMAVEVHWNINNLGSPYDNPLNTLASINAGASFAIVTNETNVLWQQPIQCERILPDVGMLDLLKDTLQRFGLILISDANTGTVKFTSFKKIVANIPNALNWTDKCKDLGKSISFQIGSYSQTNWLRYQFDDSIPLNYMVKYFADDFIAINDKNLNPNTPVADLFKSLFSPSINVPYIGGSMAQISSPTDTTTFSVGSQPRLLIDNKVNISNLGSGVTFSDNDPGFENTTLNVTVNDIISVPYFYKPDAQDLSPAASHLCWNDKPGKTGQTLPGLKSIYYPEFQSILTQSKKVTRFFYLTPLDIQSIDFTIPIYIRQDNSFYYISKIDSWVKGHPVKVDLIQIDFN